MYQKTQPFENKQMYVCAIMWVFKCGNNFITEDGVELNSYQYS